MRNVSSSLVTSIRSASRDLVRELGFMSRTLAGTELSPSAVHAIIEIGAARDVSGKTLSDRLLLEKSTVSRLVASLMEKGLVRRVRSPEDARRKDLRLTAQGKKTATAIARFAERRVVAAINPLGDSARRNILVGLGTYSGALKASRLGGEVPPPPGRVVIRRGYAPGLIGRVVEMHASYYSKLAGFGAAFETKVASGLADFVTRLGKPENEIWRAEKDGRIVGGIAMDGEDLEGAMAHLRWFIVDGETRGAGVGTSLIKEAIAFCDDRQFSEIHLWTFKGLEAARSLYESHGFSLVEERPGDQWGAEVLEQKFVRPLVKHH